MQNYVKCDTDARTFPEIWGSLNSAEQSDLRYELIKETTCTRQSIDNWSKGTTPINRKSRRAIAAVIRRKLHLNVNHVTLFPSAR